MKMSCRKWRKMLSALIDYELSLQERKELNEHLSSCPDCKEEHLRLKNVSDELHVWKDEAVSENFEKRLLEKINVLSRREVVLNRIRRRNMFFLRRVAIVACLVMFLSAPLLLLYHYKQEDGDSSLTPGEKGMASSATFPRAERLQKSLWAIDIPGYEIRPKGIQKRTYSYKSLWNYSDRINERLNKNLMHNEGGYDENDQIT